MRRRMLTGGLLAALLLCTGVVHAEQRVAGKLRLAFDARFTPRELPRDRDVPVNVSLSGSVRTTDGSEPPRLRGMSLAVNRYGKISTHGLPLCLPSTLESTSSDSALKRCGGALVGRGRFAANLDFPDLKFPVEGRMLAFHSRLGSRPAIALHIYGTNPVETTFVLMFRITHPQRGRFGTVLSTRIPRIAADLGYVTDLSMTFGRRYRYRGEARSFISARCAAPAGFPGALFSFAKGSFTFATGKTISQTLVRDCVVR